MDTVGAKEARANLPSLLDWVGRGESIIITRHGVPLARLVPANGAERKNRAKIIEEWLEYRKKHSIRLDGLTIRELIEEGRKY